VANAHRFQICFVRTRSPSGKEEAANTSPQQGNRNIRRLGAPPYRQAACGDIGAAPVPRRKGVFLRKGGPAVKKPATCRMTVEINVPFAGLPKTHLTGTIPGSSRFGPGNDPFRLVAQWASKPVGAKVSIWGRNAPKSRPGKKKRDFKHVVFW